MNLLFWKKKNTEIEESGEEFPDKPDDEAATSEPEEAESAPSQPSMLARVRTKLAAVGQRLRRRRESSVAEDESPTAEDAPGKTSVETSAEDATITDCTVKPSKRLLLAAALIALILLTAGGGFVGRKWLLAPTPADMRMQIEALKKQNRQMQEQIKALKNNSQSVLAPQPATAAVENRPSNKRVHTAPPPGQGVLIIGDKDTKASAQALKQAIEEMNAASESGNAKNPLTDDRH